jgi:hypothetical protein
MIDFSTSRKTAVAAKDADAQHWADAFAMASGGKGRRRVRREYARVQAKKVVRANRRRFRQWNGDRMAVSTVGQQLRILAGEFGTEQQRVRIETELKQLSRDTGVEFGLMIHQMREQLGLPVLHAVAAE